MMHAQNLMDDANAEEDHTLLEGTHQEIAKKQAAEKKARQSQRTRKNIVTEEQEIKRRFSMAMKRPPPILEKTSSSRIKSNVKGGLTRKASAGSMKGMTGKTSPKKEPLKEKWSQLRNGGEARTQGRASLLCVAYTSLYLSQSLARTTVWTRLSISTVASVT